MGYKEDQNYFSETYRPQSPTDRPSLPPPLPPRVNTQSADVLSPPPYSGIAPTYHSQPLTHSWSAQDPRSSSTQSLVPEDSAGEGKRTLLLIYIHGFMGNETSFQSFPAHVHNVVTTLLAETHVVHTKLYPKYKSRKAIEFARDDFSKWLSPHESPNTDVVLLGHSMGGILSAEVALLKPYSTTSSEPFQHRILGTVNFDTPFLGMHPGVVISGIGSIFRPAPDPPGVNSRNMSIGSQDLRNAPTNDEPSASSSTIPSQNLSRTQSSITSGYFGDNGDSSTTLRTDSSSTNAQQISSPRDLPVKDPNYDPPFPNDVRLATRTGWDNAFHFVMKHSDGLTKATKSYVTSHLEFGGAMADYKGLQARYSKLRALEDVDMNRKPRESRIRFVNYYTASTGRPKKVKSKSPYENRIQEGHSISEPQLEQRADGMSLSTPGTRSASISPRISNEGYRNGEVNQKLSNETDESLLSPSYDQTLDEGAISDASQVMNHIDPTPVTDDEREEGFDTERDKGVDDDPSVEDSAALDNTSATLDAVDTTSVTPSSLQTAPSLPPVPPAPSEPPPFDPAPYIEKDARKIAEKDYARQIATYKRAIKDRDKAIKDRRKLLEKREKSAKLAREKQVKLDEKERVKAEKKNADAVDPNTHTKSKKKGTTTAAADSENDEEKPENPKRDKKFCMLPPKFGNEMDPRWVRVFMPGVDEVGAHCGLFLVGEQYESLVNGVGERIRGWVEERYVGKGGKVEWS